MTELLEQAEKKYTSARIQVDTAVVLGDQKRRLSAIANRDLSTDDVIKAMHRVFVQQPETVIAEAVAQ